MDCNHLRPAGSLYPAEGGITMFKPLKLVSEVMTLAYLVNDTTGYCAFVNFAGHVNSLQVYVYPSKENRSRAEAVYDSEFYIDQREYIEVDPEERLLDLKSVLMGLLIPDMSINKAPAMPAQPNECL
jgi:hypothetical protein